jgi:hypothetical protein
VYFDRTNDGSHVKGEELNFDLVKPAETYRVKKYSINEETKKNIEKKIREWKKRKSGHTQ